MIKHVVMWKLTKNSIMNRKKIIDLLSGLPGVIRDLNSLETGENFNASPFAFDLVLITTHSDLPALKRYQNHPDHIAVAEHIKTLTVERAVVDFEYD